MSSLVIFTDDVDRLARFYVAVLGVTPRGDPWGGVQLRGVGVEVLLHPVGTPTETEVARTLPEPREDVPIKPVFDVDALEPALASILAEGGADTGRTFRVGDVTFHDVVDPDGNVLQLRARDPRDAGTS